jgi:hypothetical protein
MSATALCSSINLNMDADTPEDPCEDTFVIYRREKAHLLTVFAKEAIDFIGSRKWPALPLAMQHRCLFQLASPLLHELAHIVIFNRADDALLNNGPNFRRGEAAREVGFSWKHCTFGGIIAVADGESAGNNPASQIKGVASAGQWSHDFITHVQMFHEWKNPGFRMDELNHPPGRWLVATKSTEQFFDMRSD